MNPMELHGPDFLMLYLVLLAIAIGLAFWLRQRARQTSSTSPDYAAGHLNPFETAYLAGGPRRAVEAALSQLVEAEAVTLQGTHVTARAGSAAPPGEETLPKSILEYLVGGGAVPIELVFCAHLPPLEAMSRRLADHGLIMSEAAQRRYSLGSVAPLVLLALLGLAKVALGLSEHRPVELLVLLCIATIATAVLLGAAPPPLRTHAGDAALGGLRRKWSDLEKPGAPLHGEQLILAAGLFGTAVLGAAGFPELDALFSYTQRAQYGSSAVGIQQDRGDFSSGSYGGGDYGGGGGCSGGGGGGGGCGG